MEWPKRARRRANTGPATLVNNAVPLRFLRLRAFLTKPTR